MTTYQVRISDGAERDLKDIFEYISEADSEAAAAYVLDRVLKVIDRLEAMPHRGSRLSGLMELGFDEYRQVFFKPYRMIYRVIGEDVLIDMIADGRRDMRTLLVRRLLGA